MKYWKLAAKSGEIIANAAQSALSATLMEKIQEGGIQGAIRHCNVIATPLMDSISNAYGANIKRVSTRLRNESNNPDKIEAEILDAYEYAWENGLQSEPNIQDVEGEAVLYTRPIMISNPVCLNCHGQIDSDVLPETNLALKSLYPSDSATGYKLGDLRGMWSIRFLKKSIINQMD